MISKKIHLLFTLLLLLPFASRGQEVVSGYVLDQQTREPLIGANITAGANTSKGTVTDEEGYFELAAGEDVRQIRVSYVGYIKRSISLSGTDQVYSILLEPDNVALNEVQVVGFDANKKLQETTASVALVTGKDLDRTDKVSLQPALNAIPGVQMDQSSLGDSRISIRGSGVRSSWGIRNLKLYVNNIPLTEADGTTRIEGLDVATVGSAEVIKGPASSIYGAGTGGVISFQLEKAPYGTNSIEASGLAGSYGMRRLATTYRTGSDRFNAAITVGSQSYGGYRKHSEDDRTFFTGSLQFFPSQKQSLTLLLSRSRQESQIPGELSADQVAQNPRQASAENVNKGAGRFQTWTRMGASHSYKFSDSIENATSLYTYFYDLDHPLAFAYIRSPYQSYGGRTQFKIDPGLRALPTIFSVGGEYLNGRTDAKQYVNEEGTEGELTLNQEQNNFRYTIFLQSETNISNKTTLALGVSANKVRYTTTDFMADSLSGVKSFDLELAPRIGLTHVFSSKVALRGSISSGFSPPTTEEITDDRGRINEQVQAERGINYEIGARGNLLGERLNYDLALFSFQMKDQLVPQTVDQSNTVYLNAGRTSQRGLETAISYFWSNESGGIIHSVRPFLSYSYSDFTFKEFQVLGPDGQVEADYSGNEVTGIAPHILSAGIDIDTKPGFYWNASYFFKSETPLTDGNDVFNEAYSVVNTKVGFERTVRELLKIDVSMGVKNLTNTAYSSFFALNPTSYGDRPPAFYNPAPDRNWYTSISISYLF